MNGTPVSIKVVVVGGNFGHEAIVRTLKGRRVVHRTETRPYGFQRAAMEDAEEWARGRGYEVWQRDAEGSWERAT